MMSGYDMEEIKSKFSEMKEERKNLSAMRKKLNKRLSFLDMLIKMTGKAIAAMENKERLDKDTTTTKTLEGTKE